MLSLTFLFIISFLLFSFIHFSFIHGGGKVVQVVGGDVLNVVDEGTNGGAKFRDRVFQLYSVSYRYQGTQLSYSFVRGDRHDASMAESS